MSNSTVPSAAQKKIASVKPNESAQLDQTAWLRAAASAIAEDGFSGIRVLPLSKRLGVTRGSFYWHFADHAAFVNAFIDYWRHQQLRAVEAYQHTQPDAISAYKQLLDVVLTDTESELRRLKVEFALRGYARRDKFAADAVAVVDKARIDLFLPIVSAIAKDADEAESFATLLLIQLSGAQLAIAGPNCRPAQLAHLKEAMLTQLAAIYAVRSNIPSKKLK